MYLKINKIEKSVKNYRLYGIFLLTFLDVLYFGE